MASELEESILDQATQLSSELQEAISDATSDEQKDELVLNHIKTLSDVGACVLLPEESAEWVTGFDNNESLASYCFTRVALLDFFTYCCINCQHILPDLKDLENMHRGKDGFVIVGVHSAKFETERVAQNVLYAAERLGVTHPILNDPKAELWNRLGIHCWPTLLLLDPAGKPILVLAGEGHRDILFRVVSVALKHFKAIGQLAKLYVPPNIPSFTVIHRKYKLRFPGKITFNPFVKGNLSEPWITISDSGNNRIIIADSAYNILNVVGGLDPGLKDGSFQESRFDNPQGTCWISPTILVVCDTGNNLIRRVNFTNKHVDILAGNSDQTEFGVQGGLKYCEQSIASPWDIVIYRTPDMDLSVRIPSAKKHDDDSAADPENSDVSSGKDDLRRVLLIASAGSHQIWALFLDTTVWWRYKTYAEGTLIAIVGSGREENRNNRYASSAGLAQPSGLSLCKEFLYIADSESSTIRKLDISSGQLFPLVGGDRNPCNLFAYGDIDGIGYQARLQHPLGVACCQKTQQLYVADTYNNNIKHIDISTNMCSKIYPNSETSEKINEPGGLCVTPDGKQIYIADTNNHRIVSLDIDSKDFHTITFKFPSDIKSKKDGMRFLEEDSKKCAEITLCSLKGSNLVINLNMEIEKGSKNLHLTPLAPQRWSVQFLYPDYSKTDMISEWEVLGGVKDGKQFPGRFDVTLKLGFSGKHVVRVMRFEIFLSLCENGLCFLKRYIINIKLLFKPDINLMSMFDVNYTVNPEKEISVKVIENED